jgi:hypothetical protein
VKNSEEIFNRLGDGDQRMILEMANTQSKTTEEILSSLGLLTEAPATQADEVVVLGTGTAKADPVPEPETPSHINPSTGHAHWAETDGTPAVGHIPNAPADDEATEVEEAEEHSTLGPDICGQCGWDQSQPTITEPTDEEKLGFLHTLLGMKNFTKVYPMFGGAVEVTFRTLTVSELDSLYKEAFRAQQIGSIKTTGDYYEYINRLRINLQLQSLKGTEVALHHVLPESLELWEDFLRETRNTDRKNSYQDQETDPIHDQIRDYIVGTILKTEVLQRTVTHECNKFNRLVAKLEARVDDSDFWKTTEKLS